MTAITASPRALLDLNKNQDAVATSSPFTFLHTGGHQRLDQLFQSQKNRGRYPPSPSKSFEHLTNKANYSSTSHLYESCHKFGKKTTFL